MVTQNQSFYIFLNEIYIFKIMFSLRQGHQVESDMFIWHSLLTFYVQYYPLADRRRNIVLSNTQVCPHLGTWNSNEIQLFPHHLEPLCKPILDLYKCVLAKFRIRMTTMYKNTKIAQLTFFTSIFLLFDNNFFAIFPSPCYSRLWSTFSITL